MKAANSIMIAVVEADALRYSADALVLKYAQMLYGVDRETVLTTGFDESSLPGIGEVAVLRNPAGLGASAALFIGVEPLGRFGYGDIRDFGHQALLAVASELPTCREIAVTLHGVGFGLDEIEAFDSELAGILDAIRAGSVPRSLEQVTILELDSRRAERMRKRLAELLRGTATIATGAPIGKVVQAASAARFRNVGYDSGERGHAFVAMPFSLEFEDVFHYGISSAVRDAGLLCERIDQQAFTGEVLDRVKQQIRTARLVVADLSGANPNVYLEVGYAWGCGTPTVLICRKDSQLKFDVQGERCLEYATINKPRIC